MAALPGQEGDETKQLQPPEEMEPHSNSSSSDDDDGPTCGETLGTKIWGLFVGWRLAGLVEIVLPELPSYLD